MDYESRSFFNLQGHQARLEGTHLQADPPVTQLLIQQLVNAWEVYGHNFHHGSYTQKPDDIQLGGSY